MIVLGLALVLIVAVALLLLVAVAYPYRGRSLAPLPWLGEALGAAVRKVTSRRQLSRG